MPDDAGRVYSEELCELEADRAATLGVRVVRTFYKWYAWDAEKQVWNWESEKMQAFYRWLDRLKNAIFRLRYKLAGAARGILTATAGMGKAPLLCREIGRPRCKITPTGQARICTS